MEFCEPICSLITDQAAGNYAAGGKDPGVRERLADLTPEDLFDVPIVDSEAAECCLSGLWLLHNYLDESHEISQDIKTPDGSYWHGIMHRMEGDFWNSKHWFRQIGRHPALLDIARRAFSHLESNSTMQNFEVSTVWDPSNFSDFVADQGIAASQRLAYLEWRGLFEHCYNKARGEE
ncbi:MAG: hypothetical protein AAF456_01175 [Planctomycetota bacterium]